MKAGYKVSLVRIADIVYLESEGEYVRMHLADGTAITTLFRLKNMETALPSELFMRVNYKETFQHYIDTNFKNL